MRRRLIGVAFAGVSALTARALAPRLHARLMAGCERMFEQMPDDFPPKRMMRGVEETRANSARTLALLEAHERAREAETLAAASARTDGAAQLGRTRRGSSPRPARACPSTIERRMPREEKHERRTDHSAG